MKLKNDKHKLLFLIQASLWKTGDLRVIVDSELYDAMKAHSIITLSASILNRLDFSDDLYELWKNSIYTQIAYNVNCRRVQSNLSLSVPYVILKGTEAAKYYQYPMHRALGDIDIITRHEDFDIALSELLDAGYEIEKNYDREIGLTKNGVMIELHRSFAKLNNPMHAEYLDNLIIQNINPTHILPDSVNGLVLLEHISQHLVRGLGLRQIIDWMMFVDKCLSDEEWPEFQVLARNIGLETLAIVTTRMCEIYLGLPERKWCESADQNICAQLIEYVLDCGNFGNKRENDRGNTENVFIYARNPVALFKLLQRQGIKNWKAINDFPILRPFAWCYQATRYVRKGLSQDNAGKELREAFIEANKRKAMFDALGVRQDSKGLVVYKDGKYVKE